METGKCYSQTDFVKVGCGDCKGCHSCCQGMGESILLTPYDMWELTKGLGKSFEELLEEKIELYMTDGLILPNIMMAGEDENCIFLNEEGRCSIHSFRPGLCRLFPLGRNYERDEQGERFRYFLLQDACPNTDGSKVQVEKWMGIPELRKHDRFVTKWHYFCRDLSKEMIPYLQKGQDAYVRQVNMQMLSLFYGRPYQHGKSFYQQFEERMTIWKSKKD